MMGSQSLLFMEISIPYGVSTLTINLPDEIGVDMIEPPNVPPAANPLSVVQFALANLHGGVDWTAYSGSKSVAIAVNDRNSSGATPTPFAAFDGSTRILWESPMRPFRFM